MSGFYCARELGDGEHWDVQVAGQNLQAAGDLGHLLLAVLLAVAAFAPIMSCR